jgi:thymidylate synthase (FAD)
MNEIEIKCLDKGFVRLVDVMGDDSAIVQAARVSYGKGTKSITEDRSLIRYLIRHKHTSPFEMVEFKFHVKLPIFIARQWIRHRTANVNEYSGRYSEMPDDFYLPELCQIKPQSLFNKQGRAEDCLPPEKAAVIAGIMENTQKQLFSEYTEFLENDVAREIARINLPLSTYTEWYWKIDLHNLFHFLRLRMDSHAQYEFRVYGKAIADIVSQIVPIAYEAFEDYTLNSVTFTKAEFEALKIYFRNNNINQDELLALGLSKGEINEYKEKINKLNME